MLSFQPRILLINLNVFRVKGTSLGVLVFVSGRWQCRSYTSDHLRFVISPARIPVRKASRVAMPTASMVVSGRFFRGS